MKQQISEFFEQKLHDLKAGSNFRSFPDILHKQRDVVSDGKRMLNLSSNDYLGLAGDIGLREEFLQTLTSENMMLSASSSRLLTGNFAVYTELENKLAIMFGAESALVFNSGYHMNVGILPAVSNEKTLILADKLVHASIIDGIRLSAAKCIRYRHNQYEQLESLLHTYHSAYEKIIVVTESIFSMDGDEADLKKLIELKMKYANVLLYVDEAHAAGVRGERGLGCAEEQGCIHDIDFLTGTFGKALASVGGYVVCSSIIRDYLVNTMRTLIFTTALPPVNLMWSKFILEKLAGYRAEREHLMNITNYLLRALERKGYECPSSSHIIPVVTGSSNKAVQKAKELQANGFYLLPVRPPTVAEGSSRIRISLNASIKKEEIDTLLKFL